MHWVGSISTPSHRFCAALSGDFRHVSGKRPQMDRRTNLHIHLGFMTLEVGIWYSRPRCLHVQVLLATWSTTKDSSPPRTNKQHISLYLSQISQHLDSLLLRSCVRRGPRTQSSVLPAPRASNDTSHVFDCLQAVLHSEASISSTPFGASQAHRVLREPNKWFRDRVIGWQQLPLWCVAWGLQ